MIEMTQAEFEKRTREAADFAVLCKLPEFASTVVAFFDEMATLLAEQHLLLYPADHIRDMHFRVQGRNDVLEEYKLRVARWIEDAKLEKKDIRVIED